MQALPYLFEFWAHEHQLPPEGAWRSWVILGGRGAGKTRAGSEWVRSMVEGAGPRDPGRAKRIALVGETIEQAREVMVFGDSGILECAPPDRKPVWVAGRKQLIWPNGAVAQLLSAHDPDQLRGWQFDGLWADELAKWKHAEAAWDMLQFCLRLGEDPRACVTTTPRNLPALRALLERDSTVMTHAATEVNRANLADGFIAEVEARYAGTRLGRQELDGLMLADAEGALWTSAMLGGLQDETSPAEFDRIVVAIDPPVTGHKGSDLCGIVVAGVICDGPKQDWRSWVIEDCSVAAASPLGWSTAAVEAFHRHKADRIVAEVNQGGDMIEAVLRQVDPDLPYKALRATRGKVTRAEPVAALYERGRVHHLRGLGALEDQMCLMTAQGYQGSGSPDRVDALVWALTDLVLARGETKRPGMRALSAA